MRKKIYIAGKVTGLLSQDVENKFFIASKHLYDMGLEPVNPVQVVNNPKAEWNEAMKLCITALMQCDAVLALTCHSSSNGAKVEVWLAMNLAIPFFLT